MSETAITMTHKGRTVETTLFELVAITRRLEGTDYVKVAITKASGEWLETQPRLGDELKLSVVVTCVAVGKQLTDDGIQATAKLEVVGITVL